MEDTVYQQLLEALRDGRVVEASQPEVADWGLQLTWEGEVCPVPGFNHHIEDNPKPYWPWSRFCYMQPLTGDPLVEVGSYTRRFRGRRTCGPEFEGVVLYALLGPEVQFYLYLKRDADPSALVPLSRDCVLTHFARILFEGSLTLPDRSREEFLYPAAVTAR